MQGTWVCLIPFLIVIPISMLTKQVQPGLFVGLLVGSYLMYPSLLGGLEHMIHYLVTNIVVINNIRIVIFLYAFAGLVGMIKFTGGIKGFVHLISRRVKTKKSALLLTWISTLGTFSEPDFRIVTIGSVMKALINRLDMSKKRVGYAIEFTANPVIALIPIATAFVGYMVSVIGQALKAANIHETPYIMYVKSIPFNFFSFVIILVGIYYTFIKKTSDSEKAAMADPHGNSEDEMNQPASKAFEPNGQQPSLGGKPAFQTEIAGEMTGGNDSATSANIDLSQVSASLAQAQIDLAQALISEKQKQYGNPSAVTEKQNHMAPSQLGDVFNAANSQSLQTGNSSDQSTVQNDSQQTINTSDSQNIRPGTGVVQPAENERNSTVGMSSNPANIPENPVYIRNNDFDMEMSTGFSDIHGDSTGVFANPTSGQMKETRDMKDKGQEATPPHGDQQEDLDEAHRAYKKETPIRPLNLIIPIGLFLILTLFLSWWDGHAKAKGFLNAFIKSDMLGVMLTSLMTAVIVAVAIFIFQKFAVGQLATHFIKGGNELLNVIVMLALIWALTAVSEDLGFSHFIAGHVKGWIPHMFIAPSLFVLGVIISYFIGSSWGTWGLLMPLGVTLAAESHTSILLAIGAVFASGTFGAFCSPLSDNTVTTCTVLGLPVVKYARSKLEPALIAAGISVILFGVFSFFMR